MEGREGGRREGHVHHTQNAYPPPPPLNQGLWFTLQAREMWLLATMTHSIPAATSEGIALSVKTISAGKSPIGLKQGGGGGGDICESDGRCEEDTS